MNTDTLIKAANDLKLSDTERIDALEALLLETRGSDVGRTSAAEAMARIVLNRTDDDLVRLIASKELALYPVPSNAERLADALVDSGEDLDLRVNLLQALEGWGNPLLADTVARLADDDELRRYIQNPA